MSMFLGPIHHWLYNKINNQENLTSTIATMAEERGYIRDKSKYTKDLPSLESSIDMSNIHCWLQSQISDAEERYASLVTALLDHIDEVRQTAFEFGKSNVLIGCQNAQDVYKKFDDFFVNGMPCDHINVITGQSNDSVTWEMTEDIHIQYWKEGNIKSYYEIRKSVMDGMLADSDYNVDMNDAYHYTITRK